jgi:uncharacterized integral membrane protein
MFKIKKNQKKSSTIFFIIFITLITLGVVLVILFSSYEIGIIIATLAGPIIGALITV